MKKSRLKLIVEKGPKKGTIIECEQGFQIRIGRFVKGNTFIIYDSAISQNHLLVGFNGGRWVVTDLDTSNGTVLNDEKIPPHKPCAIEDGDVIKIGARSVLCVRVSEEDDVIVEDQQSPEFGVRRNPKRGAAVAASSRRRIPKNESDSVDVSDKTFAVSDNKFEEQVSSRTNAEADKLGKKAMQPSPENGFRRNPKRRAAPPASSRRTRIPKTEPVSVDVSTKTSKCNSGYEDVGEKQESIRVNGEVDEWGKRGNNAAIGEPSARQLEISDGVLDKEDQSIEVQASLRIGNRKNPRHGAAPAATSRRTRIPKTEAASVDICMIKSDSNNSLGSDHVGEKEASLGVTDKRGKRRNNAEIGELSAQQLQIDGGVQDKEDAVVDLGAVDASENGVSTRMDLEAGECGKRENDARIGESSARQSEIGVPEGLDRNQSGVHGDVMDIEKITLGQWLDRIERLLPKQIRDACEDLIALMREGAFKVQEFVSQQGENQVVV